MFDLFGMMDKIGKLKDAVEDVKNKTDRMTVSASGHEDGVQVVTSVSKKLQSISISEDLLKPENKALLEEAILNTVNNALREAHRTYKEEFKKGTDGLIPNIPGVDLSKFIG
jgi:DNA-binding protein YbaB